MKIEKIKFFKFILWTHLVFWYFVCVWKFVCMPLLTLIDESKKVV